MTNSNFANTFDNKITLSIQKAYNSNKITYYYGQTGKELR